MVNAAMADIRAASIAEAPEAMVCDEPDDQVSVSEPASKNPRPPHSDRQERREERSRSRPRSEARQSRPCESQASRSQGNPPKN